MMKQDDNIWMIDDDRLNVMAVQHAFGKMGVPNKLLSFTSAEDALATLKERKGKPSLILLDLRMPRMDGVEFLRILKADAEWKRIPVIILTTSSNPKDKTECYDLQVAGYFIKPVDFFKMAETLYNYWSYSETV